MDINNILSAGISLGGMGLIFGAGLAYSSKKFAVEKDPKVEEVYDALPLANCGGCGYPGCMQFAEAVVAGNAEPDGCPVGGEETAEKVAAALGLDLESSIKVIAKVRCKGDKEICQYKYDYDGLESCASANMLEDGPKACVYGCMGLGDCVDVCQFDAIKINDKGLAEVIPDNCTACGKCITACPKDIIELVPYGQEVIVECNNEERGGHVKKNCEVACIACGICERSCPFDAIHVEDNLADVDYDKCTECMICTEKCPTGAISGELDNRQTALIDKETCIGCTLCARECPVDAIEGETKQPHEVDPEKCVGCEACVSVCPVDAIKMI